MILYNHRLKNKRKCGWYVIDKRKITEKTIEFENEAAQALNVTEGSAAHDATAKKLVANKAILAYVLKSSLKEFADVPVHRIPDYIEGAPQVSKTAVTPDYADADVEDPVSKEVDAASVKLSGSERVRGLSAEEKSIREGGVYYDIRFLVHSPKDGSLVEIIVDMEVQDNDTPGYPIIKRGIYYGARMISAQWGTVFTNQHFERISKVASIWICVGTSKSRSDAMNVYQIQEGNLYGQYRELTGNYDLMEIVILRLGPKGEASKEPAIRLLSKLFSQNMSKAEKKAMLSEEFGIAVTEKISKEVSTVCNLSEGIYKRGKSEGLVEGRLKTLQNDVKNVMKSLNMSMEEALKVLNVNREDRTLLMKML